MIIILLLLSIIQIYPAEVTAYCKNSCCCGEYADGITASGYKIQPNDKLIAAPDNILFNTKIYIPEYGLATVKDRGRAIKDNRLDVYLTHKEAIKWGRKKLIVWRVK